MSAWGVHSTDQVSDVAADEGPGPQPRGNSGHQAGPTQVRQGKDQNQPTGRRDPKEPMGPLRRACRA